MGNIQSILLFCSIRLDFIFNAMTTDIITQGGDMDGFTAIIFDMDGVLVDSEPLFLKAINNLLTSLLSLIHI